MTTIVTTSSTVSGNNIALANGVGLFLGPAAVRSSSAENAVLAAFSNHVIDILGTLFGEQTAITLGASAATLTNSVVTIGAGGAAMAGGVGINALGRGVTIFNDGLVKGGRGIQGSAAFDLVNTGLIIGAGLEAIRVTGGSSDIVNHGTIAVERSAIAIRLESPTDAASFTLIRNHGTIEGGIQCTGIAQDAIENHGIITSNVTLGDGADRYDGALGLVVGGVFGFAGADLLVGGAGRDQLFGGADDDTLEGGAGNDRLEGDAGSDSLDGGEGDDLIRSGAGADEIDGGAGLRDVLDYVFSPAAVRINLATGDADGGDATGDVFTGIEDLVGSSHPDVLTGDGLANRLFGGEGNDVLTGGAGNDLLVGGGGGGADTLVGGLGVDVLRGGLGADVFRFVLPAESGAPGAVRDRILDFATAQGDRIDLSSIDADATLAGNQPFVFTTALVFSAPGEVRAQVIGANTFVFGNTDAVPGTAEFSIVLNGIVTLAGTDFIL